MKLFTRLRVAFRRVKRKFFPSDKDLLTERYIDIMLQLRSVTNLNDLLSVQKSIKEFKLLVVDLNKSYWGKPMVRAMDNLWNLKFKLWKERD